MLNIFVNSTTYGQTMGATFDMSTEGSLIDKRVTSVENCDVVPPIYQREISAQKVADLISAGQTEKVANLGKAVEVENTRVNSLAMLIRELTLVKDLKDNKDIVVAYVPGELLHEIKSGRIKFYLDEEAKTTYFSSLELELWKQVLPLIQDLYCRIVFKSIDSCKKNSSNTESQADRVSIYSSMQKRLIAAFREMKIAKSGTTSAAAVGGALF